MKMSTLLGYTLDFWLYVFLLYKELNKMKWKNSECVYEYVRESMNSSFVKFGKENKTNLLFPS